MKIIIEPYGVYNYVDDDAEGFLFQLIEYSQLKGLPQEQQDEHAEYITELKRYLWKGSLPYLVFYITKGTNRISKPAVWKMLKKEKIINAIERMGKYLEAGEAIEFLNYCRVFRMAYQEECQKTKPGLWKKK